jgi:hypothetical protein
MYKIEDNSLKKKVIIASNTGVGDLMIIHSGNYAGEILLHAHNIIISLTNPNNTWFIDCDLSVILLSKGEIITLIVE